MERHEEIERLLIAEVDQARMAYDIAQEAFRSGSANDPARNAWITALHEFSAFILHGNVPDRFKDAGETQPYSQAASRIQTVQAAVGEQQDRRSSSLFAISNHPQECASSSLQTAYSNLTTPS